MSPVSIRPATPGDIPAITRIYGHSVVHGTASFELTPPDEAEMRARMQALLDGNYPYLVGESEGAVAGYAHAGPYRARPGYRWTIEDSVYIAPDRQRRGVGRSLLDALVAAAAARDFRQMVAVIGDPAQQAPSIALHVAAGFRIAGNLADAGFKFGRWCDSMLMQRALGAGAQTPPR
jgi:L-amino acid N-acyltransferase YncA